VGSFQILVTPRAKADLAAMAQNRDEAKHLKSVQKALGLLETNPRHPSLQTHEYKSFQGPNNEKVYEAYAENKTPAAYRIFWYYGSTRGTICILTITAHP
jgi:hypothetical protein